MIDVSFAAVRTWLADPDRRILVWLVSGAVCLTVAGSIHEGSLSLPLPKVPYFSPGLVLGHLVLPMALMPFLGKNPLRYFGLGNWRDVLPWTAAFLVVVIASNVALSFLPSFRAYYGTYPKTHPAEFAANVLAVIAAGEFFFHGFLLFPLHDRVGWYAAPAATIPYVVVHVGKPLPELFESIVFGLALCWIAVRARSVLYGILIHYTLALTAPAINGWIHGG